MGPGETEDFFFAAGATMARLRFEPHRPVAERWRLWFFGPNDVYDVQVIDTQLPGDPGWSESGPVVAEVGERLAARFSRAVRRENPSGTNAVAEWDLA